MPENHFDARRAERAQRVDAARSAMAREGAQGEVAATRAELVDAAGQYEMRRLELDRREEARTRFVEENPTVVEGGVRRMAGAILSGMVKPLSVLTLDVILLAAVAEFAISLAYILPEGAPPPPWMLLPVPLTLQCLETLVGMQVAASREHARRAARGAAWGWWVVAVTLALVMPAMSWYALRLSLEAKEEVLDAATAMLGIGILALAFVCHAVMIFTAQATLDGISHLVGRLRLRAFERRAGRAQRRVDSARSRAWEAMPPYSAALDEYRRIHGAPLSSLLLARHEADLINDALGERVVLSADGDEPPPAGNEEPSVEAPPPPPPPGVHGARASTPADAERPDDQGDAQAEAEYLRRILDARLRDRDAEFHV
ncbi:MAG TPA: hypothetical protein VF092_12330 [Longimicrobium sp.]